MAKQPEKLEEPSESFKIQITKINAYLTAWQHFVKWGVYGIIAWCVKVSIESLAGEATSSNIVLSLITDFKANQFFPYLFGGAAGAYGLAQQREKKKTVFRLHSRVKELETKIDPTRTSSGLTETGDTRTEDE